MKAPSSQLNRLALILAVFLAGAAAAYLLFSARIRQAGQGNEPPYFIEGIGATTVEAVSMEAEIGASRDNAIVRASQKVGPSVVSISTIQIHVVRDPWFDLFYPFRRGVERKHYGLGSGFIIDKRGYILTNEHVIEGADEIKVTLANGDEFEASVVGADYESDLAVLKVDAEAELPVAEFGDSSDVLVGEWAIAIGSPFGFLLEGSQPTVTLGVVSATGRTLHQGARVFNDLVQTDASINPGNSGGPLVNSYGQVIAINTAIFSTSGGSQGVGFAIPVDAAKRAINELIQHGMVMKPWVGVEYQELSKDIAEHLRSPVEKGLLVSDIADGSPAHRAGLARGDIVVKIDDQSVRTLSDAAGVGKSLKSGQEVTFHIVRDGEFEDITVKVGSAEAEGMAKAKLGLVVQAPTPKAAKEYGLSSHKKGVLVLQVDRSGPAGMSGLQTGDLILSMAKEQSSFFGDFGRYEETEINTVSDFRRFISGIKRGQRIRIIYERGRELWWTHVTAVGN